MGTWQRCKRTYEMIMIASSQRRGGGAASSRQVIVIIFGENWKLTLMLGVVAAVVPVVSVAAAASSASVIVISRGCCRGHAAFVTVAYDDVGSTTSRRSLESLNQLSLWFVGVILMGVCVMCRGCCHFRLCLAGLARCLDSHITYYRSDGMDCRIDHVHAKYCWLNNRRGRW